jgi:hypothetical protein
VSKHRRPSSPRLRRTGLVLGLTATVVVTGAGSASAYWTAHKVGSGTAKTGTLTNVTFTTTATVSGLLYPGATADLTFQLAKDASTSYTVQSWTPGVVSVSTGTGTCAASSITVTGQSGIGKAVPKGSSGSVSYTASGAITMVSGASTNCQGRTFTIPITLTGVAP